MGGGGDGGSKIGGGVELTEAVLTCEGHISDPQLPSKLSHLASCLQSITESDKWLVRKVEPFNSVKVTFSIPKEAAERLYLLAQAGDTALHQLGILSVQVEGDQVISLKVNGPNNEPSEILLRANTSSSSEMVAPPVIPRQPSHSFAVPSISGGQAVIKTQPIPQFRSPVQVPDTNAAIVNKQVVGHPRSVQQGFSFVESVIGVQRGPQQQQQATQSISPTVQGIAGQRVVSVAARPAFPSNPPPPYPGQDINKEGNSVHASTQKAGPSQVAGTPLITSQTQSHVSSFRASPGHAAQLNNTILQSGRNMIRAPMNMVKNSPLLVGLLQSAEQNSPIVKSTKISSLTAPLNVSRASENRPASPTISSASTVPLVCNPATPVSRSSRESTPTLQQIYAGGPTNTNSLPNQIPMAVSQKPTQVLSSSQTQLSTPKVQNAMDKRIPSTEAVRYMPIGMSSQDSSIQGGLSKSIKMEDRTGGCPSHNKKDNQYLINPNTGLLEPRPNTDSSDSETEGKGSSAGNNCLPSDGESSNDSKKGRDISRTKIPSHKENIQERETASWHNSLISSGEKIKLKLKLGREPRAQTTIIANKKVEKRRDNISCTNSLVTAEPRVPKLHIKLHSSQPVIVKSIEDSSLSVPLDDSKNTKFRKKLSRNKLREDELKFRSTKHKDSKGSDGINSCFLRLKRLGGQRDGDHDGDGAKVPKLCDDSKITISKSSRTDKSRKPRKPIRKIGDLNSLGEIASHKIMETLPPAITKVADLHAQQQSSPTISPLFISTTRNPLGADLTFEANDRESMRNITSLEYPLAAVPNKTNNAFLPNGDVCLGSVMNKMAINPAETSTYRDSPEGLGSVKTFLNSSVLINKVNTGKPAYSSCINNYRVIEEGPEKVFKKLDGFKNCEFPLLRTTSDITIQSVSKNEIANINKLEVSKPKLENKVGRVLCVDVMDRKALEEALKSSRDSVKKAEISPKDPTTSMVDRLRRWNSIDNSSPVPFSSHQTSDSTNLHSTAVKGEINSLADSESGLSACEQISTETSFPLQSMKVPSVNNKGDCDNSCALNNLPLVDISQEETSLSNMDDQPEKNVCLVESNISDASPKPAVSTEETVEDIMPEGNNSISKLEGKVAELVSAKVDVDSPEGTPKGDHGNGQGGEDSGIESMDALSEKSPNHNDQSPHRREDKECDIYSMKCKDVCDPVQQKDPQATCTSTKESVANEATDCYNSPKPSCSSDKEDNPAVTDTNISSTEAKPDREICMETTVDSIEPVVEITDCLKDEESHPTETTNLVSPSSCSASSIKEEIVPTPSIKHETVPTPSIKHETVPTPSIKHETFPTPSIKHETVPTPSIEDETVPTPSVKSEDIVVQCVTSEAANSMQPSPVKLHDDFVDNSEPFIPENCAEVKRTLVSATPVSLTTTTIANSSIILQNFLTSSPSIGATTCTQSAGSVNTMTLHSKVMNNNISNAKSSLLAITLTRPPGSGKINSQYAATIANNLDKQVDVKPPEATSSPIPEEKSMHALKSGISTSITTTSAVSTTSMILLATINGAAIANSLPCNSKMATAKPPSMQAISTAITPPVGKAFRLVAMPGINSVAPVSSPVRGQLVTLKPIIGVPGPATTVLPTKVEPQPASVLPTKLEIQPPVHTCKEETVTNHPSTEAEPEDLDFVGFSSAKKAEEVHEAQACASTGKSTIPILSPTEDEPTPMRVQPPLYTYGSKERKKESESDFEDKEKDSKSMQDIQVEEEVPVNKLKEKILDALTIEIPALESIPDDKRLTRTTRQSARLSSPKVNNTSGDLSPHPDTKHTTAVAICKQTLRSSVSPALRGTKRKRHESESSNASSVSEDLQDSSSKSRRRKTTARDELLKGRATKFKEAEQEKDKVDSSDEDSQVGQAAVNSISQEDGLSIPKNGCAKEKEAINVRENMRRASRQKSNPEKEEPGEITEGKVAAKVASSAKPKNVEHSESEAGRRKTRSTAVSEDVPNKRRRQSKEK